MAIYAYKAIAPSGALKESRIEAASEADARTLLRGRGQSVVSISEAPRQGQLTSGPKGKKPSPDEVASMIMQLSILSRAGVPLVESLQGLAAHAKSPSLGHCLEQVTLNVSQGSALSEAFARHPNVFPNLAVEMARIAEAGGNLSQSMERLAEHMESGAEITRKVKSAMAYPIVVMFISMATVLAMVTFILPRFMKLFDQMGTELPWTTSALMSISNAITGQWYIFIAVIAGLIYAWKAYARSPRGRRTIDTVALRLPIVGDIVNKIVLSRVVATMATLLSSGVPMVQALETSASAANNEYVKDALLRASRDVAEGNATSQALTATGVFPPLVLQMVASGEKTGELPSMLDYVCALYGRETDAKVKSLTSIIEPIMIVVLGIIVGFIAMSVIVPIYSLVGGVK